VDREVVKVVVSWWRWATMFVPEVYTGMTYKWRSLEIGVKFEIQKYDSDYLNSNIRILEPTIVGVGLTAAVSF
jgi:hypothetical protein